MNDIKTYQDCLFLVNEFYKKLLVDDEISHFFIDLDLEEHLPRVAKFWAFILLDEPGYTANMMTAHAPLEFKTTDFDRWLLLFHETVNQFFVGEKATLAIERSQLIAITLRHKFIK